MPVHEAGIVRAGADPVQSPGVVPVVKPARVHEHRRIVDIQMESSGIMVSVGERRDGADGIRMPIEIKPAVLESAPAFRQRVPNAAGKPALALGILKNRRQPFAAPTAKIIFAPRFSASAK